jgi:hypothetical protein
MDRTSSGRCGACAALHLPATSHPASPTAAGDADEPGGICRPESLLAKGLAGCSPNSRLGYGSALVEVPFGVGSGREIPELQAVMGPPRNGNIVVLFYANGLWPVYAQLVFTGEVLPDAGRFGSQLAIAVPPVQSVPGGARRLDRERSDDDRTQPPDLLSPPAWPTGAVSPDRRQRARTLPPRGLPVLGRIRLPGRQPHERVNGRAVPAAAAELISWERRRSSESPSVRLARSPLPR